MPTLQTIDLNGKQIAYQRSGSGPTLLLVHGFPLDHSMWRHQFESLSQQADVIVPDLPGFGASPVTLEDSQTMASFADDLATLLDRLQISEPVTYCGLSMGGYIGWEFWRRHPARLGRLIVCDSRVIADNAQVRKGRELAAHRVLAEGPHVIADSMLPKLFGDAFRAESPAEVERIHQVMSGTDPRTLAATLRGMAIRDDFTELLGQLDLPTLVICGEHDQISPPDEMRAIADSLPRARYLQVPAAGHMAPLERPDQVTAAITEFLAA